MHTALERNKTTVHFITNRFYKKQPSEPHKMAHWREIYVELFLRNQSTFSFFGIMLNYVLNPDVRILLVVCTLKIFDARYTLVEHTAL